VRYKFVIVDVFSRSPFGGNQLAVVTDARGLSTGGMQKIAREFNFAESTFVLPAEDPANSHRVRIFTPRAELPFAGHPTVGTACAIVMQRNVGAEDRRLVLEEKVGPVIVDVEKRDGAWRGMMTLKGKIERNGDTPALGDLAAVLSLEPRDVDFITFASAGLPFCLVHLTSREAVDRAVVDKSAWTRHLAQAWSSNVFFFAGEVRCGGELYARMSAPALGVEEDPATGSAAAALVGALAASDEFAGEEYRLSILQGVAMGRRSEIEARACKSGGVVTSISVGGATSFVAQGELEVPSEYLS
jgi:trans-2,3-dihydro-3-hydroxyanthranilate isomerase